MYMILKFPRSKIKTLKAICVKSVELIFVVCFIFETGLLCVTLALLELTVDQDGLKLTEIHLPLPSEFKGMCHYTLPWSWSSWLRAGDAPLCISV